MLRKTKPLIAISISLFTSFTINANVTPFVSSHIVVLTQCLSKHLPNNYKILSSVKDLMLIEINQPGIEQLIQAKHNYSKSCGGFMDVTVNWNEFNSKNLSSANKAQTFLENYVTPAESPFAAKHTPYSIKYQTQVNQLLKQMNPQYLWNALTVLSSYPDRYANSDNGLKAAQAIKAEIEQIAISNGRDDVSVYFVPTGSTYKQPSIVAKIGTSTNPGIVIGAHMDTLSGGNKPGADDDGSGSVTVLETARTLLSSGMHFKKPIYLVWYSAEELGLIGSQYVVADFKKKNIPVSEVIQFDMTGYAYQNNLTMWLIDDYVNKNLTTFLETLIDTYIKQPVKHTTCGYACSDHATWAQNGFAASMPFESSFNTDNPYIHTSRDTIEKLSLQHMTNYASLAISFAVELGEPV